MKSQIIFWALIYITPVQKITTFQGLFTHPEYIKEFNHSKKSYHIMKQNLTECHYITNISKLINKQYKLYTTTYYFKMLLKHSIKGSLFENEVKMQLISQNHSIFTLYVHVPNLLFPFQMHLNPTSFSPLYDTVNST